MSFKIETRFSPSVVKAAQLIDTLVALSTVDRFSSVGKLAHDSTMRALADYRKIVDVLANYEPQVGYTIQDCYDAMKADRVRRAKMRREAQERREAERQAAYAMIAA